MDIEASMGFILLIHTFKQFVVAASSYENCDNYLNIQYDKSMN